MPARALVQVTRVVLDAGAIANFFQHFQVVTCALFDTLCFQEFAGLFEELQAFIQFGFDVCDGVLHLVRGGQILLGGIDRDFIRLVEDFAGQRAELHDAFHFVAEEGDAIALLLFIGRDDLQRIAAHTEGARAQVHVVALILRLRSIDGAGHCGGITRPL